MFRTKMGLIVLLMGALEIASAEYPCTLKVRNMLSTELISYLNQHGLQMYDSLSAGTFLRVTAFREGSSDTCVCETTANDSGYAYITFNEWDSGDSVIEGAIGQVDVECPNAKNVMRQGEEVYFVDVYFEAVDFAGGKIRVELPSNTVQVHHVHIGPQDHGEKWRFAAISDLHIGAGGNDFDDPGWEANWTGSDPAGDPQSPYYRACINARNVRDYLNANVSTLGFKFVLADGDLTDKGQKAEVMYMKAKVLDLLKKPSIPILGNHDIWPYYHKEPDIPERQPKEEAILGEHFYFDVLAPTLTSDSMYHSVNWEYWWMFGTEEWFDQWRTIYHGSSFDFQRSHFICHDWNYRGWCNAGTATWPEANLNNSPWGWFWIDQQTANLAHRNTSILSHHPMRQFYIWEIPNWIQCGFDDNERLVYKNTMQYYNCPAQDWIAGHDHKAWDVEESVGGVLIAKNHIVGSTLDGGWFALVHVHDGAVADIQLPVVERRLGGIEYSYSGSDAHDGGNYTINARTWDFGDGSGNVQGQNVMHAYDREGIHKVVYKAHTKTMSIVYAIDTVHIYLSRPYNARVAFITGSPTLKVEWDYYDHTYEEGFRVEWKFQNGQWACIGEPGFQTKSLNHTGFGEAGWNYYRVCSRKAPYYSGFSSEASIYVPLLSPTDLYVEPLTSNTRVALHWTDNSHHNQGYEVWRDGNYYATTNNQDYFIDGDCPNGIHTYKVRAYKTDPWEYSEFSQEAKALVPGLFTQASFYADDNVLHRLVRDFNNKYHLVFSHLNSIWYVANTDISQSTWTDLWCVATGPNVKSPNVFFASTGTIGVVWEDRTADKFQLYYSYKTDMGAFWTTPILIDERPIVGNPVYRPSSAVDNQDFVHIAVLNVYQGQSRVLDIRFPHDRPTEKTYTQLPYPGQQTGAMRPYIAVESDGRSHYTWTDVQTQYSVVYRCRSGDQVAENVFAETGQPGFNGGGPVYCETPVRSHYIAGFNGTIKAKSPFPWYMIVADSRIPGGLHDSPSIIGNNWMVSAFWRRSYSDIWQSDLTGRYRNVSMDGKAQNAQVCKSHLGGLIAVCYATGNSPCYEIKLKYVPNTIPDQTFGTNARRILTDNSNNLHFVYSFRNPDSDTALPAIYHCVSTDLGGTWSAEQIGAGQFPALAMSENGTTVAVSWLDGARGAIIYRYKDWFGFWSQPSSIRVGTSPQEPLPTYAYPSITYDTDTIHVACKAILTWSDTAVEHRIVYLKFPFYDPSQRTEEVVDGWSVTDTVPVPYEIQPSSPSVATDFNRTPYIAWSRPPQQNESPDVYYSLKYGDSWFTNNISYSADSSRNPCIDVYGGNVYIVWQEKVDSSYAIMRYLSYIGCPFIYSLDTVRLTQTYADFPTTRKNQVLWHEDIDGTARVVRSIWDDLLCGWTPPEILGQPECTALYPHGEVWQDFVYTNFYSVWTGISDTVGMASDLKQVPAGGGKFAALPFPYYYMSLGDSTPFTLRRTGGITIDSVRCDYSKDSLIYFLPHTDTLAKYRVTLELYLPQSKSGSSENDALEIQDPETADFEIQKGESWVRLRVDSRIQANVKLKPGINRFTYWVPQTIIAKNARLIVKKLSGTNVYCHRIIWEQYATTKTQAVASRGGTQGGDADKIPLRFYLDAPGPNPFAMRAMINYGLAYACRVRIRVYDVAGREVGILRDKEEQAGAYSLKWDAKNMAGGVYFIELQAGKYFNRKKVVLVR